MSFHFPLDMKFSSTFPFVAPHTPIRSQCGAAGWNPLHRHFTGISSQWALVSAWPLTAQTERRHRWSSRGVSAGVSGGECRRKMKVEQNNRIGFISMHEYSQTPTHRLMKHLHVDEGKHSRLSRDALPRRRQASVWQVRGLWFGFHHRLWLEASITSVWHSNQQQLNLGLAAVARSCRVSVGSTPVPAELSQFSGITLIPVQ